MADVFEIFARVEKGLTENLKPFGFTSSTSAASEGEKVVMSFFGENRAIKVQYFDKKLTVTGALKEGEISEGDYARVALMMLDPEEANDKDIRYIVNEITESVSERFGKGSEKKLKNNKLPSTVSKNKVENGGSSYDPYTLGFRISDMAQYSELKEAFKENYNTYGEFLAEEFFREHANPLIIETIRKNNPQEMKRLFGLLNDMYLDGTCDTQSLIVVTILGALNNDQQLLANCTDYICNEMLPNVVQVNRYLASSKSARMRLENPPEYKPKKKKKSFVGSRIGE